VTNWNTELFLSLNALAGVSPIFDFVVVLFGTYVPYLIAVFPLLLLWKLGRSKVVAINIFSIYAYALVARFGVTSIIRYFFPSPRPFLVIQDTHQLIFHQTSSSLPSGHAVFFFALAAGIWIYNRKLGYIAGIAALLISIARVIAGVHWPFDIVLGFIVAVIIVGVCHKLNMNFNHLSRIIDRK
jgi:undecaprenyl-diphosphatase